MRVNRAADTQARAAHFSSFVFIDVLNLFGDLWNGIERKKQYLQSRLQTAPVGLDSTTRLTHPKLEPFGFEGAPEPAHYWRFLDIVEGRTPLGAVHPMRLDPSSSELPDGELRDLSRLFDACYSLQMDVMERVWGVGDESPLIDSAMVPLMNHAEKPIALALLREPWPDGSGEVAGPPFAWDPMPMGEMLSLARRLDKVFDLGPTVETLDQVSALLPK